MKVLIPSEDGININAEVFYPASNASKKLLIINGATRVPKEFYRPIAKFFSGLGYTVIAYDYGQPFERGDRNWNEVVRKYGANDFEAVLSWAAIMFPAWFVHVIGHGIGGSIIGFAPSCYKIGHIMAVGCRAKSIGNPMLEQKLFSRLFWRLRGALHTMITGTIPSMELQTLNDIEQLQNLRWKLRAQSADINESLLWQAPFAKDFRGKLLILNTSDDVHGYDEAKDRMPDLFVNARATNRIMNPQHFNVSYLGFFGFFLAHPDQVLWNMANDWFSDHAVFKDFAYARFDDSAFPLVVITISNLDPTDEMAVHYLETMASHMKRGPIFLIIDLTHVHWVPSSLRKYGPKYIEENKDVIQQNHRATAYIAPNFFIRNFLSFFHKIQTNQIVKPAHFFKTFEVGKKWILREMESRMTKG